MLIQILIYRQFPTKVVVIKKVYIYIYIKSLHILQRLRSDMFIVLLGQSDVKHANKLTYN